MDIQAKVASLKIKWIFQEDPFCQNFILSLIPDVLSIKFWECTLKPKDIAYFIDPLTPPFWRQVCESWFKLKWEREGIEIVNPKFQIIWCNSYIRIADKPILNKKMAKIGCMYLCDICNENGQLLTHAEFVDKWGEVCNWLQYNSLISAIPPDWYKTQENLEICPQTLFEYLVGQTKPAAILYSMLIEHKSGARPLYAKISKFVKVSQEQYILAFSYIKKVTNIVKYRDFQYRLLTNAIHANNRLYYWKIKDSQQCDYCEEYQNVKHMLYDCKVVDRFWKALQRFLKKLYFDTSSLKFNFDTIFLNIVHEQPGHLANFVVLTAKQYLYRCKCQTVEPHFPVYKAELKTLYAIETYNAKVKNRTLYHSKKWQPYTGETVIENVGPNSQPSDEEFIQNYLLGIETWNVNCSSS